MRIVVDARLYGLENAGIGRYIINLINQIENLDKENKYFILLRKKYFEQLEFKNKNFKKILADYPHYSFKEQIFLPLQLFKVKPDLVHFPHFNVPIFWWGKYVVTIHDLIKHQSRGPQTTTRQPIFYWFKYLNYKILVWLAVKRAVKIITPSNYWKEELMRRYSLPAEKIVVTYEGIDKKYQISNIKYQISNILDRWIISMLNQLIDGVTKDLDDFNAFAATQKIETFVNSDLSGWYVRRSRERVGPTIPEGKDKKACYQTLWYVLINLSKITAPFIPFLSEYIYKDLTGKKSVHLEDWPRAGKADRKLLEQMELVRKICELGHAERKRAGIKVRQPLAELRIANCELRINKQLINLIKKELNVKKVVSKRGKGELKVRLDIKITSELRAEGEARELVRQIQELRKKAGCRLDEKIIVYAPNLPATSRLQDYLKKETLAEELKKGKTLKIVPV